MFRKMRRSKQQLAHNEAVDILEKATAGVLAVSGDDGYPYAVPLSYVYLDGNLYFHCGLEGHKLDAIQRCDKVSFCVIDRDEIRPEEYTSYFRSVVAFGRARLITDPDGKRRALAALAEKYSPEQAEGRMREMDQQWDRLHMVEIAVEHLTGKEAIELVRQRQPEGKE